MKVPDREHAGSAEANLSLSGEEVLVRDVEEESNGAGCLADSRLIERCLAGEVAAWEDLYAHYHRPLMLSIRKTLGRYSKDPNLVDEIAARVWYALVENDGQLLSRYDPVKGGRLLTFMITVAKFIVNRHFRSEERRSKCEFEALRDRPHYSAPDSADPDQSLEAFLSTLSRGERDFCTRYLLEAPSGNGKQSENGHSPSGIWQVSRRVYRKLVGFLGGDA